MARCLTCGTAYPEDVRACPDCGHIATPHTCERCGEEFEGTDACPACGRARIEIACETHPDRKAVGRCVVCGRAMCEGCGSGDSMALLCEDHADVTVIQGWAQIYTTTSEFEAQLLRDNLAAEGLEVRIYSQKDRIFSVDLGELSIVRLLIPAWEHDRAAEVIRAHMDQSGEVSFACPDCGEAYEPGTTVCENCGFVLVPSS